MKKTTVVFRFRRNIIRYFTRSCKCSQLCTGKAGNAKAYIRGSASICRKWRAPANDPGRCRMGREVHYLRKPLRFLKNYYGKHCNDNTKPYAGVVELIETLKEKGYAVAIVSNKIDFAVKELNDLYF